ncbi:beta-1,6-N-acetylglucosaminyltransferase [Leptolyngbya sp. FACHB-261]|uniref:beta-1,6-N-acetylglucosaminyltransferase n=1 Tax=Leptolyngbya sp. FACHB-261 TaxID=2692806 RepID=UPI00168A3276|nr:beta-1,6-N-acetylglucosaminyltransferase [Leptolyngbya sp. FACHB-261]MBD2105047.1 N-acetylglucosaminyltransferase [Leptolyngbya sp. FACHB-261]
MKVVYLIQTHQNLEQIQRLVQTIQRSSHTSRILISHDFSCGLDLKPLGQTLGIEVLNAKGGRGDFSTTQGYLDAVQWLLEHQIEFDWLINLSGQDYPTQPLPKIEKFLAQTQYEGLIEYFEVLSPQSQWRIHEGHSRYFYQYWRSGYDLEEWQRLCIKPFRILFNYIQPWLRLNSSYSLMLGTRAKVPFNDSFRCYGGSHFKTLSRKCAEFVYESAQQNPDLVRYYQRTCVPEESFMQTVLVNSGRFKLCNDPKRYFDFLGSQDGRPRVLTAQDYPTLSQDNIHFARKFDLRQDRQIFDLLDARILQGALSS